MIPYTEFLFSNIIGKCVIKKAFKTEDGWEYREIDSSDYPLDISEYKNVVIEQVTEDDIVPIYPNNSISDLSVVMEYAAIDIMNVKQMLSFCNTYGLPSHIKMFAGYRCDYFFDDISMEESIFNANTDIPFNEHHNASISLSEMADSIYSINRLVTLIGSLNTKDYGSAIDVITYTLINEDRIYRNWSSDAMHFNDDYNEAIEISREKFDTINEKVLFFIDAVETDTLETETMPQYSGDYSYPQHKHRLWQAIILFLKHLIGCYEIKGFTELHHVVFDKDIDITSFFDEQYTEKDFVKLTYGIFLDAMNSKLGAIQPEFIVVDNQLTPNWRILSLESAMVAELFTKINPYSQIRKCANPTCRRFFSSSADNSRKIYCSMSCAQVMAKRKQRMREKRAL